MVGDATIAVFEVYVERVLAHALRPGQVVMDNLAAHKGIGGRAGRQAWLRGIVLTELFAQTEPHRGGVLEGQGALEKGGRSHDGGAREAP